MTGARPKKAAETDRAALARESEAHGNAGTQGPEQDESARPAPGSLAPDFVLQDELGVARRLSDFRGRPVVLFFYPADDTPGCTKEACNFRDDYSMYADAGAVVLGVSPDSAESHASFKAKYSLPFPLLADPGHEVCSRYGVWGQKQFMGLTFDGVLRTTFLIDRGGRIVKIFVKVRPAQHSSEILAALATLT